MSKKAESQAGGRPIKPAAPTRRKRRRLVAAALAVLAVGVGAWIFWPRQRHWEEITLDLGNGVTMRLVLIPAGKFMMGSPDSEPGREDNEGPQHEVTISKPFYMGVFEVTQEQYQQLMGANPSSYKDPTRPVERVSWHDAMAFCKKLSERTGKRVTLPTEAQWEYACRAGTTTAFYTGDELKPSQANADFSSSASPGTWEKAVAWVRKLLGTRTKAATMDTMPVGSYPPNAFGLYDMHGNVSEWSADWYDKPPASAKNGYPAGPSADSWYFLRGGDWYSDPSKCRSASCIWIDPDARSTYGGFRVAVDRG